MKFPDTKPVLSFKSAKDFRRWLEEHHAKSDGIWLRMSKKGSGSASVNYAEALDEALCSGWIDGQTQCFDEASYLRKFTPRRPRSAWSRLNTQHVKRLLEAGAMRPAGLAAVEAAKADGRWAAAYDSPSKALPPEDLLRELAKHKQAKAFFEKLSRVNVYSIVYRLQTAKTPERRERWMKKILTMLAEGKTFHPQA
jgi:uncharacterized protein YdeI (YjbR/CyaY-like superfamily)